MALRRSEHVGVNVNVTAGGGHRCSWECDGRGRRDCLQGVGSEEYEREGWCWHGDRTCIGSLVALHRCYVDRAIQAAIGFQHRTQRLWERGIVMSTVHNGEGDGWLKDEMRLPALPK